MASRTMNQNLDKLIAERERLRSTIGILEGELRGIERAIELISGDDGATTYGPADGLARGAIKRMVLDLLDQHADSGLKTLDVVDLSGAQGMKLDRQSVASLLSRLTKDGVLEYDRERKTYRPTPKSGSGLFGGTPPLRSVA